MAEVAARPRGRRKPVLTVRPLAPGEPGALREVRLREMPDNFGAALEGAERHWLSYDGRSGELNMVWRSRYLALLDWDGRTLHQIETEYYEPEFPEARLLMQQWVEQTDDAWHTVMWGQHYPNAGAELKTSDILVPRLVRAGATAEGHCGTERCWYAADAETFVLDSCGRFQAPCLRVCEERGDPRGSLLREFYVDAEGNCLLGRYWRDVRDGCEGSAQGEPQPGEEALEQAGRRYALQFDQVPTRLVFAIW